MSEAGVTPGSGRGDAPFRARAWYAGYAMFGSGDGAVLVARTVARDLRRAAEVMSPHETGGLLYGRTWRDAEGRYVVIDGFVQAGPDAGKTGEFSLSAAGTQLLQEAAARSLPDAEQVGWWHTHRAPSGYSATDFAMQREFQHPASVGLLVFAAGSPWANAYLGPNSRQLGPPGTMPAAGDLGRAAPATVDFGAWPRWNPFRRSRGPAPTEPAPVAQPKGNPLRGYRLAGTPGPNADLGPGGPPWPPAPPPDDGDAPPPRTLPLGARPLAARPSGAQPAGTWTSGTQPSGTQLSGGQPSGGQPSAFPPAGTQPTLPARSPDTAWQPLRPEPEGQPEAVHHSLGMRAVLGLAVCAGLGAVIAVIVLAVSIVSSATHRVADAVAKPSLTWSCHHNAAAPGIYACVATALPPGSTIWWLADGKQHGHGLVMTITVHRPVRIEPVLITPTGQQYSKGSQVLVP